MDLSRNALVVDYTGATVAAAIRNLLNAGRGDGTWNGAGLSSSSADGTHTAIGYAEAASLSGAIPQTFGSVDGTAVLVRFTLMGDADLNATVDTLDFNYLAANFGATSQAWLNGDFNYDGSVDTIDFNSLAANFGGALPGSSLGSLIPEPAGAATIALLSLTCVLRRQKRSRAIASTHTGCHPDKT